MGVEHEQLKRQKLEQILHQDMRTATELANVSKQQQQFYSLQQTTEEQSVIADALQNAQTLRLTDNERYRLQAISGRNIAHILVNQNQFSQDSPEMDAVKKDVAALEQVLNKEWVENGESEAIAELETAYQYAIASCQYYCDHKNPTFRKGKQRKMMVQETLANLRREFEQVHAAHRLFDKGELNEHIASGRDLLMLDVTHEAEKFQSLPKQEDVTQLSYADFASLIGTQDNGQITFSESGLQVIKNKTAEPTIENFEMRSRLFVVAMQKMGEHLTPEFAIRLQNRLGLDAQTETAMPLDASDLYELIAEVNLQSSEVSRTLQEGENADPARLEMAKVAFEYIGGELSDWNLAYTTQQIEQKMREHIKEILNDADGSGIAIPELTESQMDVLVKGNLPLLRDRVFAALTDIFDRSSRVNGGEDCDLRKLLKNKNLIAAVTVNEIKKITATNSLVRSLAESEQEAFVTEKSFELADKRELFEKLDRYWYKTAVDNAADDLDLNVERRIPHSKAWRADKQRMKRGCTALTTLCERLKRMEQLQDHALKEGMGGEDDLFVEMLVLASDIREMFFTKDGEETDLSKDMAFVAMELPGKYRDVFTFTKRRVEDTEYEQYIRDIGTQLKPIVREKKVEKKDEQLPENQMQQEAQKKLEELGEGLGAAAADVLKLLVLTKQPSLFALEQGEDTASEIFALYKALHSFTGNDVQAASVTIAGVPMQLVQGETGTLSVILEHRKILLPFSAKMLSERMESDMMSHQNLYKTEDLTDIVRSLKTQDTNSGEMVRVRSLLLKVLSQKTGKAATFFTNISDTRLRELGLALLENNISKEDVIDQVHTLENPALINGEEAVELIVKSKLLNPEQLHVEMVAQEPVEEDDVHWNKEESQVQKLFSDLLFTTQTWELDEQERKTEKQLREAQANNDQQQVEQLKHQQSAERMKRVIENNIDGLFQIMKNPEILDDMLDKLPLPNMGEVQEGELGIKEQIRQSIHDILDMPALSALSTAAQLPFMAEVAFKGALKVAFAVPGVMDQLAELDEQINAAVETSMSSIQTMINDSVEKVLGGDADQDNEPANQQENAGKKEKKRELRRENYGKSAEEQKKWIKDSREELQHQISQAANGERGQGLFIRNVFKNYFGNVSRMDQRMMLASTMRSAKPYGDPAPDATEEEKRLHEQKVLGNYLGGVLKGAGPLLQKMMQGLPIDSMPAELQLALKDMRSNLAPIPPEYVKAQLHSMIERSQGKITDIKVEHALGAASVAQAFLCKLHGPDMPPEGQDVVVKLLRPNVRNHMMREKDIMIRCAKLTDHPDGQHFDEVGGMEATYRGQLMRIEEELDLTIEAGHVEEGKIYNKGVQTVQAMKLNPLVEPTVNSMVLERAPGMTLDKYLEQTRNTFNDIMGSFYHEENNRKEITHGADIGDAFVKLSTIYTSLEKRQQYLIQLADKWVTEGIFGQGFYHGDMHAGNLMISDDQLTVIDFGNATQLDLQQQSRIIKMMLAASEGDMKEFRHNFHSLLENTPEEKYQEKREELGKVIKEVFAMGNERDTGSRIAVVLLKAQELGLELPPAIANFSQSQIRLQQSIDEMNTLLKNVKKELKTIETGPLASTDIYDLLTINFIGHKDTAERMAFVSRDGEMHDLFPMDYSKDIVINAMRSAKTEEERKSFLDSYEFGIYNSASDQHLKSVETETWELWRLIDEQQISEEEQSSRENKIYKNLMKGYDAWLAATKDYHYGAIHDMMVNENLDHVRGGMRGLLREDAYMSAQLSEALERLDEAKRNESPELEEAKDEFRSIYLQIQSHNAQKLMQNFEKIPMINDDISGFFDVMADVINTNQTAAAKRLGFWRSTKELIKGLF